VRGFSYQGNEMNILLEKGNRGLLVGKTGSGKSQNAMWQLKNACVGPVFILDTKIEDAFFSVPEDHEELDVVHNIDQLRAIAKRPSKEWPDFVLIRPGAEEVRAHTPLDDYTHFLYNNFGPCFIYFDELYNWHDNGRAGSGLMNLLTRGRSRGKTTLMATQRPVWVSRFCLTESDKFYVHKLNDERDKQSLAAVIPNMERTPSAPKYHFWHYDTGADMDAPVLFKPVPLTEIQPDKIFTTKWL
jgi:hypothetical protein